ncbi:paraquat-inducible protein A [Kamptonema cortianum]|uniref:Paraquat-inducible protein A n=1 Tax=Geitlerinema calcuttense NRMC-F 0142 TaxID=2922238 RepID=A0ABT7LY42_9CYAN|nr:MULTISPECIES: paraquat-inducible protein A [Cyanophyceae]MDK3157517.1 paraquat-inducible protein A [Kamptonema cortianum]MDL5052626.1 paraquat-inducible protein A [Oscillatoria laete-virens NRMC-F 0139]MDL5056931.1 paraquat-inducible protein A [Geitlerinema calcuttense NRMC-F 0142]
MSTGREHGIVKCLECGAENRLPAQFAPRQTLSCHRCGERLSIRKPHSLQKTWAFVLAGLFLYPAANLFPVMTLTLKGDVQHLTVWGGVMELYDSGMAPVALLVFCASIIVPFAKLAVLFYLCVMAGSNRFSRRDRTRLYRIVEAIGVWSMVDIFLLSILVALGQLGVLATVVPQVGAVAFAAVVILTLFAADFFDPRLIWDEKRVNCQTA